MVQNYNNIPNGIIINALGARAKEECSNHKRCEIEQWIAENKPSLSAQMLKTLHDYSGSITHEVLIDHDIVVLVPNSIKTNKKAHEILRLKKNSFV